MLFDKCSVRSLQRSHRRVMTLMATYCGQRATAGLIIAEGALPGPNGLGDAGISGLYGKAQADACFDGVELHDADGDLIEHFLNPLVKLRPDRYGGSFGARDPSGFNYNSLAWTHSQFVGPGSPRAGWIGLNDAFDIPMVN